ncbi:type II toxin-antitoxin system death-on-curing family toxin [Ammoniphilus sp. 3BR4]|uniref:type II toxin-antitoxin system death-on-curing family toxin n=1 Tax=Ammoniphilus sp. 3BR4 TaxID=3158265 RepID=UPI0034673624
MRSIELADLFVFHAKIVEQTGGSPGVRDLGLIESALQRPFITFDEKDMYPTVIQKISVMTYALIKNHGFVDGNKRVGVAMMLLLLRLNEIMISYSQAELIELGLKTAEGVWTEKDIERWIKEHQT